MQPDIEQGPVYMVGGAVKQQVWQSILSRKELVVTAANFVKLARQACQINFKHMTHNDLDFVNKELNIKTIFKETKSNFPGAYHDL